MTPNLHPDGHGGLAPPFLSVSGLAKSYAGVPALADVALTLHAGEIHALMGENGAGKSTLIRVLAGVTQADRLDARVDGQPVALAGPADAARLGFRFVHQELNVVPVLSVAENILLGRPLPRRLGLCVDWTALNRTAAQALARFGVTSIDPAARVARLRMGDRMLIRLASMLVQTGRPARLFVLDEPTAALTHAEAARLFAVLRDLRGQGAAILYVSHRLDEVMALSDRITVLRDGRTVLSASTGDIDRSALIRAMIGRDPARASPAPPPAAAAPVVAARAVSAGHLRDLDFTLSAGEVLGIAGLENAGQSELLRLFMGEGRVTAGQLRVGGAGVASDAHAAWRSGVAFVPRDRRRDGLAPGRSVTANIVLPHLSRLAPLRGMASARAERRLAASMASEVRLKAAGLQQPVRALSGGNQQKVLLARALAGQPELLLLDDPTRGVDIGAREDIHGLIRDAAARGCAVLLATTDLPEMLLLCDRVLILRDGRQAGLAGTRGLSASGLLSLIYGEAAA